MAENGKLECSLITAYSCVVCYNSKFYIGEHLVTKRFVIIIVIVTIIIVMTSFPDANTVGACERSRTRLSSIKKL